jgi:SOS-response transcriptional repressor LexA
VLGFRQFQVRNFVIAYLELHGRAPSYGIIRDALGFPDKTSVRDVVKSLEKRGVFSRVGDARVRLRMRAGQSVLRLPA